MQMRMRTYHVIILNGHQECDTYNYTFKLCLAAETKLSASMVTFLYVAKTKVNDILFQNSKLYSLISWGLFILNPPSGWGFDKPEVQIPTLPPICPAQGVMGLDIAL